MSQVRVATTDAEHVATEMARASRRQRSSATDEKLLVSKYSDVGTAPTTDIAERRKKLVARRP